MQWQLEMKRNRKKANIDSKDDSCTIEVITYHLEIH